MFTTIAACLMLASCGTVGVGPEKPLNLHVAVATEAGESCGDDLLSVRMYRSESDTEAWVVRYVDDVREENPAVTLIGQVDIPAEDAEEVTDPVTGKVRTVRDGFIDGVPWEHTFRDLSLADMVENVQYFFYVALVDWTNNVSALSLPSEDTLYDSTPPDTTGAPEGVD